MSRGIPRNGLFAAVFVTVPVIAVLVWGLGLLQSQPGRGGSLFVYCAAGMRPAVAKAIEDYQRETGVQIKVFYGGSETLLSQIAVTESTHDGDLFIAADDSYIQAGREQGLVAEDVPLAELKPVMLVAGGNPKKITGINDLLRDGMIVALGNPDQAAIGKKTRKLLQKSGHWDKLEAHVTANGVFLPTVPEVANAVKTGSADAAIIWDATARQYDDLEIVTCPELDVGLAHVTIGVLKSTQNSAGALAFARYLTAPGKGQAIFKKAGFTTVPGDRWSERPEITFYAGAVNRRALEPIIKEFSDREGVTVNTVYNGCGILTGQMKEIQSGEMNTAFPDIFMACDVYYLDVVQDWFEEGVNVSDTDIVMVVPKGNPAEIETLRDLGKPGLKIVLGQPKQCTIGVLTRQLLTAEGLLEKVKPNIVAEKPSSSMLVPAVVTNHADVTLAYKSDTLSVSDQVEVIAIDSTAAKAVQPYSIAKTSEHKEIARRLFKHIARSGDVFRKAGFQFRLPDESPQTATTPGNKD